MKRSNSQKNLYELHEQNFLDCSRKEDAILDINIDMEVNNISDLLMLIDKYKVEPKFKYNIDMDSLHKIKDPLIELNNMVGMKELKTNIVEQIIYFIQDLHNNSHDFMHTVIYGPPGTGKTEIAKIMGKIFSNIGLLSKDTVKKVTRSDLIAGYVGQTALKTRDVIKDALGGVLFIDEAYSLGNSEKKDSFSKECIDTLCEALSNHKQDLMVIIAGYENELNQCFFNYNQGLESRFAWRFKTDEYSGKDLHDIFIKKVKEIDWSICENENTITPSWFEKNIEYFKFYGRDIESLLAKTKIAHSKRVFCKDKLYKKKLTLEDLDNGLKLYLKNNETHNNRSNNLIKKQLQYSMYN
jgi:SpoVK/Ycf46/Vps4 family AAA+-type ATPase